MEGITNIICVYAPTLQSPVETKDQFYELLDSAVKKIPKSEQVFLLGDFNARVGADQEAWPSVLGHHGVGKMNDNGQRLLELCCFHKLCVTNTFFQNKACHKVSWRHPRSRHWHQLDLVITRRDSLNNVCNTRTYHSADCNTDHSLIASAVKTRPKKLHHSKQQGQPRINIGKTMNSGKNQEFAERLKEILASSHEQNAIEKWKSIRNAIYNEAILTYGKKEHKNTDWFEANTTELEPAISQKRLALINYKRDPSQRNLQALRAARKEAQQMARRCANNYWLQLASNIQLASDTGNIRAMYEGIRQATGKPTKKSAPLKTKTGEIIIEKDKQLARWVEHYLDLYSRENIILPEALYALEDLTVMEELDAEPTHEELSKAIDALANRKAPGEDNIPPELIKCGKPALLDPLHELLCLCWKEGEVPQEMRDAKIITLYKNKGDRSDCNNYRGISLLSIVGKVFARVVLARLQILANRIYPESQCGFRAKRSTVDMIFSVRQLQEKCREQQMPLYIAFIDLTKAFDLVSRTGLFQLLKKIGCPPQLLSITTSFHENMKGTVSFDGETSESFDIKSGVKQGCVLAPTLFGIFFSMLLDFAFKKLEDGIFLHTRSDGNLFNLARLKARSKVRTVLIRELLFADDAAIASHTEEGLQRLINRFADACSKFGLTISIKKTNIMTQDVPTPPSIAISGEVLEVTDQFTYLGSTVTSNLSMDTELSKRIAKAAAVMSQLNQKVWNNNMLSQNTKLKVYQACVLSTLLYGSESWTTYARQENRLESFHLRCLRRILSIRWQDRVPNTEVLESAGSLSMHLMLTQRRLRWLGHVHRMEDGRIPKDMLYGQLASGHRRTGRPMLRYKDVCKRDLKLTGIGHDGWEVHASDRNNWRHITRQGVRKGEGDRTHQLEEKRARRKEKQKQQTTSVTSSHVCLRCGRDCLARIGLLSHTRRCKPN